MYIYKGKLCSIEELTTLNDEKLFLLMSNFKDEYEKFVFNESISDSYYKFKQKIEEWFSHGRTYQFLVFDNYNNEVVGTMFFYDLSNTTKSIKCSCFFAPKSRNKILVIESLAILLEFAKFVIHIQSLNFSVYKDNVHMHKLAKKCGALKSGDKQATQKQYEKTDYSLPIETIDLLLNKFAGRVIKLT